MTNINTVAVSGNLVADCEKGKAGETPIITFVVAVNEYRRTKDGEGENYANFFECTMFGKRVQGLAKYMTKGQRVTVLGHLRQSRWEKEGEKKSKVSIVAEEVELFIPKQESDDLKHEQLDIPW